MQHKRHLNPSNTNQRANNMKGFETPKRKDCPTHNLADLDAASYKNAIIDSDRKSIMKKRMQKKRTDLVEAEDKAKILEDAYYENRVENAPIEEDNPFVDQDPDEITEEHLRELEEDYERET